MEYVLFKELSASLAMIFLPILREEGVPVLEKSMSLSGMFGREAMPGGAVRVYVPQDALGYCRELFAQLQTAEDGAGLPEGGE